MITYRTAITNNGLTITDEDYSKELTIIYASKGNFRVTVGTNGTAIFHKPNGTTKEYYHISANKLNNYIKQTIAANNL